MDDTLVIPLDVDIDGEDVDLEVECLGEPKLNGDYEMLTNKPQINGVELLGNKTSAELGIVSPVTSVNGKTGDVELLKDDVGLGKVDNTSDTEKKEAFTGEISVLSDGFVTGKDIAAKLVDYLPKSGGVMIGNIGMGQYRITSDYEPTIWSYDASVLVNRRYVDNQISGSVNYENLRNKPSINGTELVGDTTIDKTTVGLGNVDNTSDATKKANFTGTISDGNTGFITGDQAFDALALKLDLTGGALTGPIVMNSHKITGLATGTNNGDAVNLGQLNEAINQASANYKGSFVSKAALDAIPWQDTNPNADNFVTNNDYAYIADDETHNHEAWRYIYSKPSAITGSWAAAYRINEAPLTEAQIAAINSGITEALVLQFMQKQNAITANGILKGNGSGVVSSAIANTDYQAPVQIVRLI